MQPDQTLDYEALGVAPPTHEPHNTEAEIAEYFAKPVKHGKWVQRGNYITCQTCPFEHSHPIDVSLILKGTDKDGKPILTKVV